MLDHDALSDDDLLRQTKAGDARSFGLLYARHRDDGLRYARRLVGTAAEDVVAEAVTKVYEALHRGYGPRDSFRPYLFTAIRSVAQDVGAKRSRTVPMADPGSMDPGAVVEGEEVDLITDPSVRSLLVAALNDLTPAQRQLLWYIDGEQRQPIDLAPGLGISPNAVSARAYRARRTLRRRVLARALRPLPRPLVCVEIRHRLDAYVVGGLAPGVAKAVEHHLDTCARCERSVLGSSGVELEHDGSLTGPAAHPSSYRSERGPAGEVA